MSWKRVVFFVASFVAFIVGLTLPTSQALGRQDLKDRFLREAPKAWEEFERRSVALEFMSSETSEYKSGTKGQSKATYKANGKAAIYIAESGEHEGSSLPRPLRGEVWCIGDKYVFSLRRETPTTPWAVSYLAFKETGPDVDEIRRQIDRMAWVVNHQAILILHEPINEMFKKPYFKVLDVRPVNVDGDELVEVQFDYPHPADEYAKPIPNPILFDRGKVVLDPRRYWCIRSFECTAGNGESVFMQRNTFHAGDVPSVATYELLTQVNSGGLSARAQIEKVEFSRAPPKSDFTLTSFGLPEPYQAQDNRLYIWVAVAGLVLLVLGVVVIRRYSLQKKT